MGPLIVVNDESLSEVANDLLAASVLKLTEIETSTGNLACMPFRLHRPLSRPLNEKVVRAYAQEAARLRNLAINVTTAQLRTRLLEEADNQDRLALAARRGTVQPHPIPPMQR